MLRPHILTATLFLSLTLTSLELCAEPAKQKQILVLQSRKEANVWTAKINQLLSERFESDDTDVRLESVRYQTLGREDYLEGFLGYLYTQYAEKKSVPVPEVVVAVGRAAFDFTAENRAKLFPDTPVVYSGPAENVDTLPYLENSATVLMETDYARNVELMRRLHPDRDTIFLLFEDSIDGQIHLRYARARLSEIELGDSQLKFISATDTSTPEMLAMIRAVQDDAVVLIASWAIGDSEQSTKRPVVTMLSKEVNAPLYDLSNTSLGFGIVGGMLATPEAQAQATSVLISRILAGEPAASIPLQKVGSGRPVFDYRVLEKWSIPISDLPDGATIVNRPSNLWYDYREYVLAALALFVLQGIAFASLAFAYKARKRLETERAQNEAKLKRKNQELEENLARTHTLARELKLASQAKSDFLSIMNHELRTPLNAVIGFSELLLQDCHTSEDREYLSTINASGHKLLGMVNRILSYSHANPQNRPLKSKVDIDSLIADVIGQFQEEAISKGLKLEFTEEESAKHTTALCDEKSLTQIINNFVDNAIKFTESGLVSISLSKVESRDDVPKLRIQVSDTGIGIAPEIGKTIFAPFQVGDTSRSRSTDGIGLGLALCKINATQMEASVGFTSKPSQGSIFWIEMGGLVEPENINEQKEA